MKTASRYLPSPRQLTLPLAVFLWLGCFAMVNAGAARSATLSVSATIAKRATLKVLAQPASLLVTDADLTRGYVEVASPVQVAVQSNSTAGYLLVFESLGDLVSNAQVRGLGDDIQLGASGVVPRAAAGAGVGRATHNLVFRFMLSSSAQLGRHAWPMQISVLPM